MRALGGVGYNGGVQLLRLDAMRSSAAYAAAIERYAAGGFGRPGAPPMKGGGIGWLGDQTLYSWMSVSSIIYISTDANIIGDQTLYSWMSVNSTGPRPPVPQKGRAAGNPSPDLLGALR